MKPLVLPLLLVVFLTLSSRLHAQQDSSALPSRFALHRPLFLFVEPSALISGWGSGSLRGGLEFPLARRLALQLSASWYGWLPGYDGWGEKVTLKWYAIDHDRLQGKPGKGAFRLADSRLFYALEYFHKAHSYQVTDSIIGAQPPMSERIYHVEKEAHTLSFHIGEQATLRCGLVYEGFVGGGLRLKTVWNDLLPGESDQFYHWHEGMVNRVADPHVYNTLLPHISLGFRIGYRFR